MNQEESQSQFGEDPHLEEMPISAAISTAEIAGKKFVSGLYWQPLTKPRAYKKEAQEIGKREGMDIVAIRKGRIMQAGFAPKGQGAGQGMYSMAAALAAKLGNSWIGVFSIGDDRYAFLAVNDGAIVPGSDVIGNREDVEHRIRFYYGTSKWAKVYAPADFDFGGEEYDLNDVLSERNFSKSQWRDLQLRPLKFGLSKQDVVRIAVVAGVGIAIVFGYRQYLSYQAEKTREALVRAAQLKKAEEDRIKEQTKAGKVVVIAHPWAKSPAVEDFMRDCGVAIDWHPLSIGGWIFSSASCDGATVKASYSRVAPATPETFIEEVAKYTDVVPSFPNDLETVTVSQQIKILLGGDDELHPAADVLSDFGTAFQKHSLPVSFTEVQTGLVSTPVLLPGQTAPAEAAAPAAPAWRTYNFKLETEKTPGPLFEGRAWNGMRISNIEVKLASETATLNWTITGKVYAK